MHVVPVCLFHHARRNKKISLRSVSEYQLIDAKFAFVLTFCGLIRGKLLWIQEKSEEKTQLG